MRTVCEGVVLESRVQLCLILTGRVQLRIWAGWFETIVSRLLPTSTLLLAGVSWYKRGVWIPSNCLLEVSSTKDDVITSYITSLYI